MEGYFDLHYPAAVDWMRLDDADLLDEFGASDLAAFHTLSPRFVERMATALKHMENRGLADGHHYRRMHGNLVLLGDYAAASALRERLPAQKLSEVPPISVGGTAVLHQPGFLELTPGGLQLLPSGLPANVRVVVISHPLCRFSRDAMRAILGDAKLRETFSRHAVWVLPPQRRLYMDQWREWAAASPDQRILHAHRPARGSYLQTRTTPTFYFLVDGEIRATVTGWRDGAQRTAIEAALAEVGLPY